MDFVNLFPSITVLQLMIALLLLYLFFRTLNFIKFRKRLSKIPGPKGLPILGNVFDLLIPQDKMFKTFLTYSKLYYPIYHINAGPFQPVVFIMLPNDVETLICGIKNTEKGPIYEKLEMWLQDGLLLSKGKKWQYRRKLLTPAFHFNILTQFVNVFIEQSEKLIDSIKKRSNKPIDVTELISKYTLHTIAETAMGVRLECLNKTADKSSYIDTIYRMGQLFIERIGSPWLYNRFLFYFSRVYWETRRVSNNLRSFTLNVICERERTFHPDNVVYDDNISAMNSKKNMAMLDLLLLAKLNGNRINHKGIQEEVDTFMFEGHDTTAMSISFTLMLLACHKNIQDLIHQEIQDILINNQNRITMQDLNNMNYLERVIKESLRLYPSVAKIGRITSEDMNMPSGYFLPRGTTFLIDIYTLHRDSNIYPDPNKFDPDRFLPELTKDRHPCAYIPFSAGPRNCIGQKFAMLEMKTVLADIIKNFELFPVDTPETLNLQADIILRNSSGIKVIFKRRIN